MMQQNSLAKMEREEESYEERSALGRYRKQTIFFING
jgi:hypothetical protein